MQASPFSISIPKCPAGLPPVTSPGACAAEIGRQCGATTLTWKMHVRSTLWSGPLATISTSTPPLGTSAGALSATSALSRTAHSSRATLPRLAAWCSARRQNPWKAAASPTHVATMLKDLYAVIDVAQQTSSPDGRARLTRVLNGQDITRGGGRRARNLQALGKKKFEPATTASEADKIYQRQPSITKKARPDVEALAPRTASVESR